MTSSPTEKSESVMIEGMFPIDPELIAPFEAAGWTIHYQPSTEPGGDPVPMIKMKVSSSSIRGFDASLLESGHTSFSLPTDQPKE